jgi:hypothetical protein
MNNDLEQWLGRASQGLTFQAAQRLREEVVEHYNMMIEDHLQNGADKSHAHRAALEALGDPQLTMRGLIEVYRSKAHYRSAAVAAVLAPTLLFIGFWLFDPIDTFIPLLVLVLVSVGTTLWSCYVLLGLLSRRFAFTAARLPLLGSIVGGNLMVLSILFTFLLTYLFWSVGITFEHPLWELLRPATGLMQTMLVVSALPGGVSMTAFAVCLRSLWGTLYGMRVGLQFASVVIGVAWLGYSIDSVSNQPIHEFNLVQLSRTFFLLGYVAYHIVLAIMFLRAAVFWSSSKQKPAQN